ncbi:MAG: hypothetical protein CHACPFDD_02286 [Phycisphaerae bacterium]|nr:hypothetical protein [Phycisphaerae bacterium]
MANVLTLKEAFEGTGKFEHYPAYCPHCGIAVQYHAPLWTGGLHDKQMQHAGRLVQNIGIGRCPSCQQFAIGVATIDNPSDQRPKWHYLWPLGVLPDKAPAGVDPDAKRAYDEARAVFSLSSRAAAILARRALQRVIREKLKIEKRTLFEEIEEAVKLPDLSRPTREAIGHIREFGNWGAHPLKDKSDPAETLLDVTAEQARYTIQVLELVFHDLYELPTQIAAMKAQIGK